ncbi:MAG: hypothetical protein O3B70_05990 [Bacteroidetes bacterium]|nr:hypothetical protein [Bacteroidota bacterium]MDA0903869.1 hypothetical protein [Bacteroidota bacterium]MDA1243168.1 hypothetical protein [Bacteroidota bacterium]
MNFDRPPHFLKTTLAHSVLSLTILWAALPVAVSGQETLVREWNEVLLEAIRHDYARPTIHARNLHHWSLAVYDAWAAYDSIAAPFLVDAGIAAIEDNGARRLAQETAINYASYRLLWARFQNSPGGTATLSSIYQQFNSSGGIHNLTSTDIATHGPAALGNAIAAAVLAYGLGDGSNQGNDYANQNYAPVNPDLFIETVPGNPTLVNMNRWQSINLSTFQGQSGISENETPPFLSPEWGLVAPFALPDSVQTMHFRDGWPYPVWLDQGPPPLLSSDGLESPYSWGHSMVLRWSEHLHPDDGIWWDISPGNMGNVDPALFDIDPTHYGEFYNWQDGGDPGEGHAINPTTGQPYEPQWVPRGDFTRVLAEFWADGPDSETPPGHWFTLLNGVTAHAQFTPAWKGEGEPWDLFDWEVCAYFTLGGALHDAAIAAWSHKGWYDYIRPVSAIRWMQGQGQCTDPSLPNFDPVGLPLVEGVCEMVLDNDPDFPEPEHLNKIKVRAWRGPEFIENPATDVAGVGWILAERWWPYQRPSFVTPPFAGYVSGHSTFSRAAAEVLTFITGDPFFPGGMGEFHAPAHEFLVFEEGPSHDVVLQWATYRDASDQCSLSRIWGGIHPPCDDLPGRRIGIAVAEHAIDKALSLIEAHKPCPADFNGDGTRNVDDLLVFLLHYNSGTAPPQNDLNIDGSVDVNDMLMFLIYYNTTCS